jgi:hypothetical protein
MSIVFTVQVALREVDACAPVRTAPNDPWD